MAITVDQPTIGSAANDATASSIAFTTSAAVASNGFIVITVTWLDSGVTLSSISGGGLTWAIDIQGVGTVTDHSAVCSAQAPAGLASSTTITATFSSPANARAIGGASFLGVLSAAALDTTSGPTTHAGSTAWTSANTTIAAGSLLVAGGEGVTTSATSAPTSPSLEIFDVNGGAGTFVATAAYRIEATGAAYTVAGTWSASQTGVICAAAYKAAPTAAGSRPVSRIVPLALRRFLKPGLPRLGFPIPDWEPAGTVWQGAATMGIVFGQTSTGTRKTFSAATQGIVFGQTATGKLGAFGSAIRGIVFGQTAAGVRKTFSSGTWGIVFTPSASGIRKALGSATWPIVFSQSAAGTRKTFGTATRSIVFGFTVAGTRKTFGVSNLPIVFGITTNGQVGAVTWFGTATWPIVISRNVAGTRKTFGTTTLPIVFTTTTAGTRKTFGTATRPIIFTFTAAGFVTGAGVATTLPRLNSSQRGRVSTRNHGVMDDLELGRISQKPRSVVVSSAQKGKMGSR